MKPITAEHHKLITLPISEDGHNHVNHQNQQQCLFYTLSCGSKSKQLNQTIQNQIHTNQASFQLSQSKHLTMKTQLSRDPNLQLSTKREKDIFCQESRKGICLTGKKSQKPYQDHNKTTYVIDHTQRSNNSPYHPTSLNTSTVYHPQSKVFHKLNPLSIDRGNYDSEVKLGSSKGFSKTIYSVSHSISKAQGTQCQNEKSKTAVKFNYQKDERRYLPINANEKHVIDTIRPKTNYIYNTQCKGFSSRAVNVTFESGYKTARQTQQRDFDHFAALKIQDKQHLSPFNKKTGKSIQRHENEEARFKKIYSTYDRVSESKNLTFSYHADKSKVYIDGKLISSEFSWDKVKQTGFSKQKQVNQIKFVSEHNQKSQNNQNQSFNSKQTDPTAHQQINASIPSQSLQSSFTVVESKQKELQKLTTESIYGLDSFVRGQFESYNNSKQLNSDNNGFQEIAEDQCVDEEMTEILCESDKLRKEIADLYIQLSELETQEDNLRQQKQFLTCQNPQQLDSKIEQLQCLKLLSMQRGDELQVLHELIRTKKIIKSLERNNQPYDTYLKDEKAWQLCLESMGNFDKEDSSHQTSETHSQQIFMRENHQTQGFF